MESEFSLIVHDIFYEWFLSVTVHLNLRKIRRSKHLRGLGDIQRASVGIYIGFCLCSNRHTTRQLSIRLLNSCMGSSSLLVENLSRMG